MENHENTHNDARAALKAVDAARASVAARIDAPRWLDATIALSTGAYLALSAYLSGRWLSLAIAVWVAGYITLLARRHHRAGVESRSGRTGRAGTDLAIVWLVIVALFFGSLALSRAWEWAPIVGAVVCSTVAYAGFRWANGRAVAAARGGATND